MGQIADEPETERRNYDLAVNLTEQYLRLLAHWQWGDSILESIRQSKLRSKPMPRCAVASIRIVWPHASRSSFVTLLVDKDVHAPVSLENAVGMRLTFRQAAAYRLLLEPVSLLSEFPVTGTAYQTWAHISDRTPDITAARAVRLFEVISYQ